MQWKPEVGLETSGPSRPDQPFTMKATLRFPSGNTPPSAPAGQVQFWVNGKQVGSAQLVNGIAQLETSVPTAGRVPIRAVYAGDGEWFAASESFPGLTHLVQNNSPVDVEFISIPFPGYPIIVEGVQYMTPVTLKLQSLTQYRISAPAMHDNGDGTRRLFSTWSDDGAREHAIIAPRVSERYKVYTSGQIRVQAFVNPAGLGTVRITPPSNDGWYPVGTRFQFEAVPGSASLFTFFSGAINGSTNPQQVTLYEPASVLANFVAMTSTEPRPPGPSLIASIDAKGGTPEARVWRLRIANTGGPATSAQITGVKFTQTGGAACTTPPAVISALPVEVPALTSGVSFASVTINFAGCVSAARFSVEVTTQSGPSSYVTRINSQYR
jgi:hypothetical protein